MAVIELVEALTVSQQAVGEAERARGTRFAGSAGTGAPAGAAGVGAASAAGEVTADAIELADTGEDTGPGGDTSPAVVDGSVDPEAQAVVTDVFNPDGERQDDGDVNQEPTAQNTAVVDDPALSPELAEAAAAEVNAAEVTDAATAGVDAPGGDAAPDPK
jgi:large subunit ribosomal protein L17